jgi:branched-chain amino acid transport system substrate-binding protein
MKNLNLKTINRRNLIKVGVTTMTSPIAFPSLANSNGDVIVVGQSLGFTSPLSEIASDIASGSRAMVESVNARGGINGKRLILDTMDDSYQSEKTLSNVETLIDKRGAFCILNIMGTPNCAAILPLVKKSGVPFIAPMTGAEIVRTPTIKNIFNIRAGYRDEIGKLVQHLDTVGQKNFFTVYQSNSFGNDGLASIKNAVKERSVALLGSARIENDSSNAAAVALTANESKPLAVIIITAGKPTIEFIRSFRKLNRGTPIYALSVMGTQANVRALGSDGVGVVVASVVPFPWNRVSRICTEYQADMLRLGQKDFSFIGLESYINTKVMIDAMRRTSGELTREKFISTLESMTKHDLGGFEIGFGKGNRQGSKYVELTIIGDEGKFRK